VEGRLLKSGRGLPQSKGDGGGAPLASAGLGPDTGEVDAVAADNAWDLLQWFEFLSYLVTIVGLPFAIVVFAMEQRRERQNEEEEIFQRLADEYTSFLKLVLDNSDLQLLRRGSTAPGGTDGELTPEQRERKFALFGILVSIFERAYMLVYDEGMSRQTRRLWQSWDDYMREWCRRPDFREALETLLEGEDADFQEHIRRMARAEATGKDAVPR
jgi:hypothetical protein